MKRILVTGSIAYDILLSYDGSFADAISGTDLEHLSVSFFSPHFARHHGGTGANIAWNLKLLQQEPLLVGTVGNDGGSYTALLQERGIDISRIQVLREHVTATAIIGTDDRERQIAFFHPGADAHGSWPVLSDDREDIAFAIVSARDASAMIHAIRYCKDQKIPYLFDPGQQVIGLSSDELLSSLQGSAGVVANSYEWSVLSEKTGTDKVLEHTGFLAVTHGEEGVTIYERMQKKQRMQTIQMNDSFASSASSASSSKEVVHVIPACIPDRVINPTGAGDALRAGLLAGLSAGWSLRDSGRLGASIASFVLEQEGTLIDFLDLDDVRNRAERMYGDKLPELP